MTADSSDETITTNHHGRLTNPLLTTINTQKINDIESWLAVQGHRSVQVVSETENRRTY
jgi:hypothetical protein